MELDALRERPGEAPCVPSPGLAGRLWRFLLHLDGMDCDCQCDGHEEDKDCTDGCSQCHWCRASDLSVAWAKEIEVPDETGDIDA